jgi:hypothetical protein
MARDATISGIPMFFGYHSTLGRWWYWSAALAGRLWHCFGMRFVSPLFFSTKAVGFFAVLVCSGQAGDKIAWPTGLKLLGVQNALVDVLVVDRVGKVPKGKINFYAARRRRKRLLHTETDNIEIGETSGS